MILNKKPTNNDIVEKIQEMFLVLQSVDSKWTTPEIMSNFLKLNIRNVDENIEKQIDTVVDLTSKFLINNGLLEKGIIDDKYMKDLIGKPGYKLCADFSRFQLCYVDGQIEKKEIIPFEGFNIQTNEEEFEQ